MKLYKSITTVNTPQGWAVRQRNHDGTELFIVCPAGSLQKYTLAQAERAAQSLIWHLNSGGETYAKPRGNHVVTC